MVTKIKNNPMINNGITRAFLFLTVLTSNGETALMVRRGANTILQEILKKLKVKI